MSNPYAYLIPVTHNANLDTILMVILGSIAIFVLMFIFFKVISSLRFRGKISRTIESRLKTILAITFISFYIVFILLAFRATGWIIPITVVAIAFIILLALRPVIENVFAYILILATGIIREGEHVAIKLNNVTYEGVVVEVNSNYTVLRVGTESRLYIPNSFVVRATVLKPRGLILKLKTRIRGIDTNIIPEFHENLRKALMASKRLVKSGIAISLVEIHDKYCSFLIEAPIQNPKNALEAQYEVFSIIRDLASKYGFEVHMEALSSK